MTTITTKIAESGRTSFQLDGKRASKAAAIEAAIANMKNGSDNLVDIQIAIDAAKKTVRFDINYYGEIIWQEIKSVKQYKSIGGGYYETYYSPEWTRTTEERANELFAEFGLNTDIISKMVFADNTDNAEENTTEAGSNNTAQIEETEQKFFYTTNRGNTREVTIGETGTTVRSRWYYYHEIGGMREQAVIEVSQSEGAEFINALCKFIANDTDGSEEDDAESFTANVMPAEDDDTDDELIDEPDRRTIERNSGNYSDLINGEYVKFENHSIVYIDAERKIGFSYDKLNGRKNFYRYGRKIAAAKIAETYMNGERAAEQSKAHHEFFYAHKLEVGNPFKVSFEITTADGQEHFFSRTFETFAEAKALVDEFSATFSEPTQIVIKQNKQNGDWFYSRDTDGSEKFFDAYFGNDGFDPEVFSLLPALDDLNDVEDEPTTEDFTAYCYYTYTKDGDKWSGSQAQKFTTATEAANWIINLVRDNGYTLTEPTNIRDWEILKRYYMTEADFNAANTTADTVEIKPTTATAKVDRLVELKGSKLLIYKAINNALRGHYVKLESGEFYDASDAGFTTTGIEAGNPIFDKLYFKDENGAYVEVSEKAIDAFNRLESEHGIVCDAIKAEIARTAVKFEVGKWYTSDETDWDGNTCDNRYCVLKRTKKFVTIYDYQNDDWHFIDNYDPDDEIDGEFDCIFRKKIQFDERGEYVDWRDDDGELVTLCAKDVTVDKPVDEDPDDDDAEDDATEDNVEVETATDKTETPNEVYRPFTIEETIQILDHSLNVWAEELAAVEDKNSDEAKNLQESIDDVTKERDDLKRKFKDKQTPEPAEVKRGAKFVEGKFYNDMDWATFGAGKKCFKILKRTACYVTIGDYSPFWHNYFENGRYKIQTDSDGNEYIHYWSGERLCAQFLTVDENIRGSLKRAAEIARKKYHEYEREGDNDGMLREIELFSICTDAIKELEAA